jgi:hypothetical protein
MGYFLDEQTRVFSPRLLYKYVTGGKLGVVHWFVLSLLWLGSLFRDVSSMMLCFDF